MLGCLACVLQCIFAGLLILLGALAVDFLRLPRSRFYSWPDLLKLYVLRRGLTATGKLAWWMRDHGGYISIKEVDERFVLGVLAKHASSDYGRDHEFARVHSLEDFRRTQPLTDYEDYRKYIDQAMTGKVSAMFDPNEKITCFFCSSGTTGASKHIPTTAGGLKFTLPALMSGLSHFCGQYFQPNNLRKMMTLPTAPRWRYTASGVKIGPVSGHNMSHPLFSIAYTIPLQANIVHREAEALHVGLVLAMRDRDVHVWDAGFVFTLHLQLQFLERNWRLIVEDIRSGRLSTSLDIDDDKRRAIDAFLSPEPARAAELQRQFEKGMDDIIPRVFPNMVAVSALSSGSSMAQYRDKVRRYVGELPVFSTAYAASEGLLGLNVREPSQPPAYALLPGANFVEFLPVDNDGDAVPGTTPLLSNEVTIGDIYEIVVTNADGFYRYRMGDVVRVVGFYHQAPTFDFQFRRKQMLNVHMEKVSEAAFTEALRAAIDSWSEHELVDFTTAESVLDPVAQAGTPPYYLVILELNGPAEISDQQLDNIDERLQQSHYVYSSFRVKSSIGPMRVVRVEKGAFLAYRQHVVTSTQTTTMQFKPPRVLKNTEQVKFFLERAV